MPMKNSKTDMTTPTVRQRPILTMQGCRQLIDAAVTTAALRGLQIAVAVTDPGGALLGFLRMDGAPVVTVDVAIGKARTASLLGAPSKVFEDMINAGQTAMLSVPRLVPLQGGVPVMVDGTICGAIGISGSSGENDEALARDIADSTQHLMDRI